MSNTPARITSATAVLTPGDRVTNVSFPQWGPATVVNVQTTADGTVYVAARYDRDGVVWSGVQSAYARVATESNVPTSELRTGDVVAAASGWVRVGELLATRDSAHGPVLSFDGTILGHAEQVSAGNDTARWIAGVNRGYAAAAQWTIQGNDLARWTRETA